jgi:hypothetical protein
MSLDVTCSSREALRFMPVSSPQESTCQLATKLYAPPSLRGKSYALSTDRQQIEYLVNLDVTSPSFFTHPFSHSRYCYKMHLRRRRTFNFLIALVCLRSHVVVSFDIAVFDRFRTVCPACVGSIRQFEPALINSEEPTDVYVAVYRSNNNKPSVLVKDEFLRAMRSATDSFNPSLSSTDALLQSAFSPSTISADAPVAVARLRPATGSVYMIDSMRCLLEKEKTDESCDGGSEHTEALATAIDSLLLHYLVNIMATSKSGFDGTILAKATLTSAPLLAERGFREVTELTRDMVTHESSLDDCLERYAAKSISASTKSPATRQRAIDIVSHLGRIDRDADLERSQRKRQLGESSDDQAGERNPWASPFF